MTGALLRCLAPRPAAGRRILCLPYAGGGPATYTSWERLLPDMEVWTAVLPGHPGRLSEPPADRLIDVSRDLADALHALPRLPLVLFGHSMGAVVALDLAQRLEAAERAPALLCVSGRAAPSAEPASAPLRHLDDDAFVEALRERYGGLPPDVVANAEIMELMLPVLRADIRLLEEHPPASAPAVGCPLLALGGTDDRSTPESALAGWAAFTTGSAAIRRIPGGHFFLEGEAGRVTAAVVEALQSVDGARKSSGGPI